MYPIRFSWTVLDESPSSQRCILFHQVVHGMTRILEKGKRSNGPVQTVNIRRTRHRPLLTGWALSNEKVHKRVPNPPTSRRPNRPRSCLDFSRLMRSNDSGRRRVSLSRSEKYWQGTPLAGTSCTQSIRSGAVLVLKG